MRPTLARGLGATCAVAAAMTVAAAAPSAAAATRASDPATVVPGESIQQALDHAADGATVVVRPGRYAESLTITRPVHLVALPGAVLVQPATPPDNLCTRDPDAPRGVTPGLCIAGAVDDPDAQGPTVTDPVDDVTVSGLTIRGFDFAALEAYGARHLVLDRLTATDDAGGGVFVAKSSDVRISGLDVHGTAGRGLDLHDGYADVVVRNSSFTDNLGEGVFVGDGTGAQLIGNRMSGNCVGISAVDLGLPGGAGISHLHVRDNEVRRNNRFCLANAEGAPSQSGTGIALVGVVDSVIADNEVTDNVGSPDPETGGPAMFSLGGIALLDAATITGGATPHDNLFVGNVAVRNAPFDVLADGSGTGNRFVRTTCDTATLPDVCSSRPAGATR